MPLSRFAGEDGRKRSDRPGEGPCATEDAAGAIDLPSPAFAEPVIGAATSGRTRRLGDRSRIAGEGVLLFIKPAR